MANRPPFIEKEIRLKHSTFYDVEDQLNAGAAYVDSNCVTARGITKNGHSTNQSATRKTATEQKCDMKTMYKCVVSKLALHWTTVDDYLEYSVRERNAFKGADNKRSLAAVLENWIATDNGRQPKTCSTFITVLKELDKDLSISVGSEICGKLQKELSSTTAGSSSQSNQSSAGVAATHTHDQCSTRIIHKCVATTLSPYWAGVCEHLGYPLGDFKCANDKKSGIAVVDRWISVAPPTSRSHDPSPKQADQYSRGINSIVIGHSRSQWEECIRPCCDELMDDPVELSYGYCIDKRSSDITWHVVRDDDDDQKYKMSRAYCYGINAKVVLTQGSDEKMSHDVVKNHLDDPIEIFCAHHMCYNYFMEDWVQLLGFRSEKRKLEDTIEMLQKENTELKSGATQVQNVVKEMNNKLNMLSESFEKRIQKVHSRFQRKLKIIRKEQENWKEQYDQLKKKHELQSEHQINREAYWETRCENLKKQNCNLMEYIAQFPKVLEAVKKN